MKGIETQKWGLVAAIVTIALLTTTPCCAKPNALPPQSTAYGQTVGEWSVAFWQWLMPIQNSVSPIWEGSGPVKYTLSGQKGHVIFLTNVAGSTGPVVRSITLPSGHPLFFPIWTWNADNYGFQDPDLYPLDVLAEWCAWYASNAVESSLYIQVDGVPVRNAVARGAGTGTYYVPETDNWWLAFYPDSPDAAGMYYFAVDGYYGMVPPLSVGKHVLRFGGTVDYSPDSPGDEYYQDVTYLINVVPAGQFKK